MALAQVCHVGRRGSFVAELPLNDSIRLWCWVVRSGGKVRRKRRITRSRKVARAEREEPKTKQEKQMRHMLFNNGPVFLEWPWNVPWLSRQGVKFEYQSPHSNHPPWPIGDLTICGQLRMLSAKFESFLLCQEQVKMEEWQFQKMCNCKPRKRKRSWQKALLRP